MAGTAGRRLRPGRCVAAALGACAASLVLAAWPAPRAAAAAPRQPAPARAVAAPALRPLSPSGAKPQAASPARPPKPPPGNPRDLAPLASPAAGNGGCGFFNFGCQVGHAIDSWFADLVQSAINPLFALLGETLLSTPQVGGFSTVRGLWTGSLVIADTCYVLLVLAGGLIVMGHQTVQVSYAVKDIAPRLVVGFIAANLSLLLAGKAIAFADGMSAALAGQGLDPAAAGAMLRSLIERVIGEGSMFFILLALFAVALVLVLTIIYVARLMLTVVLIAMAPLALACHALPQTEGFARWWWRAFAGILAIQSAQALVLVAAARIFFTEQWAPLIVGPLGGDAGTAAFEGVQLLCLLYILIRIPFWIYRRVWSTGGRSPLRSAARFVFAAAVLRRVAPVLSGRAGRAPGGRAGTGGRRGPGGAGPRGPSGPRPGQGPQRPGGRGGTQPGPQGPAAPPAAGPGSGPGGTSGPGRGRPGGTGPRQNTRPGPPGPPSPGGRAGPRQPPPGRRTPP
jgi:hypothetical protein